VKHQIGKHRLARIVHLAAPGARCKPMPTVKKVFVFLGAGHDNPASENRRTHLDA
jgi:hypothetical protein